jgi:hypothetical protein
VQNVRTGERRAGVDRPRDVGRSGADTGSAGGSFVVGNWLSEAPRQRHECVLSISCAVEIMNASRTKQVRGRRHDGIGAVVTQHRHLPNAVSACLGQCGVGRSSVSVEHRKVAVVDGIVRDRSTHDVVDEPRRITLAGEQADETALLDRHRQSRDGR